MCLFRTVKPVGDPTTGKYCQQQDIQTQERYLRFIPSGLTYRLIYISIIYLRPKLGTRTAKIFSLSVMNEDWILGVKKMVKIANNGINLEEKSSLLNSRYINESCLFSPCDHLSTFKTPYPICFSIKVNETTLASVQTFPRTICHWQ